MPEEKKIENVLRFDRSVFGKVKKTDEGYIRGDAVVTRTGIFEYTNQDGTFRRELRLPDEVFNADSLESMKLIPITNGHPNGKFVNATNAKDLTIGTTGETIKRDGDLVTATILITRNDGVNAVHSGRRELSLGYYTDLEFSPGIHNGQRYDAVQRNIRYNHLAIVDSARAGKIASLNIDEYNVQITTNHKKGAVMPNIVLDGIQYESAQEVINAHTKAQKENSELKIKLDSVNTEIEKTKATIDEKDAKIADLITKTEAKTDEKIIQAAVNARINLIRSAEKVLDEKDMEKIDEMSDINIKKSVILKKYPETKMDEKSDEYITARFDGVIETVDSENKNHNPEAIKKQKKIVNDGGTGEKVLNQDEAREKMIERMQNAWKPKKTV